MNRVTQTIGLILISLILVKSLPSQNTVPAYGGGIGQVGGLTEQQGKEIIQHLASIDQKLDALPKVTAPKETRRAEQLVIAQKKCLSCHTPTAAQKKGDNFILFKDDQGSDFALLSARAQSRVKEAVLGGTMPPEGRTPLTPEEKKCFE